MNPPGINMVLCVRTLPKIQNIDPVKAMIPVRPVVHYMKDEIYTDIHGATQLNGLCAAGEYACLSIIGEQNTNMEGTCKSSY